MKRLTTAALLRLGSELSERERELVQVVARLKLASHTQLSALLTSPKSRASTASAARAARRVLQRLTEDSVLSRLERRIGGLRAGSAGYVYYLGPAGQRLVAYWQGHGLVRGRTRPEPGSRYVRHRLAVSELYVEATVAARRGELKLLDFEAEPDCWRSYVSGMGGRSQLKPDAYVRLGLGAYEDRYFVEVDLGTESRSVLRSKLQAYLAYYRAGVEQDAHGVFPRVVFLTSTEVRKAVIVEEYARLDPDTWRLFAVKTLAQGLDDMAGDIEQVTRDDGGAW